MAVKHSNNKQSNAPAPITKNTQFHKGQPLENHFTFPIIPPRWYQLPAWKAYHGGIKNIFISWARRHGKDVTSTCMAVDYALKNPNSSVVLLAPTQKWSKKIYWNEGQSFEVVDPVTGYTREIGGSLLDVCIPKCLRAKTNSVDGKIFLHNGSVIEVQGSDLKAFVGQKINFLVISEAASHKKEIFPLLSPVMEESGGITIYNGTVTDDTNHFWKMMQNASKMSEEFYVSYLTPEITKLYYWISEPDSLGAIEMNVNPELKGKINPLTGQLYRNLERRKKLGESKAFIIREYLNIPTNTAEGSYYDELLRLAYRENRVNDAITYNHHLPVYTSMDIGLNDRTCVCFFQQIEGEIFFVDYYENSQKDISHYIDIIRSKPYEYGGHFAPHDIKKRSFGTAMNPLDIARKKYNFQFLTIPKTNSTINDIQVIRSYSGDVYFNKHNCQDLLKALFKYHENIVTGKPQHDDASDPADSFRYAMMAIHAKLLPKHKLMGNNDDDSNLWKPEPYELKNTEDYDERRLIDQSGNFATSVSMVEDMFGGETFIGEYLD